MEARNPPPADAREGVAGSTSKLWNRRKQDVSEKGQGGAGGGYVMEGHTSGGRGKMEIGKIQSRGDIEVAEMAITDLASVDLACNGLSDSGEEINALH